MPRKSPSAQPKVGLLDLLHRHYVAKGMSQSQVIALLQLETELARGTVERVIYGRRINANSAKALEQWAYTKHGEVLDVMALVMAPSVPQRKKKKGR